MLYFSSNGKGGLGGQDIFKSKGKLTTWTDAEALPKPINSPADEDYFSLDNKREKGFFASNRSSESSTEIKTCCDDIYAFYLHPIDEQKLKDSIEATLPKSIQVPLKIMFENVAITVLAGIFATAKRPMILSLSMPIESFGRSPNNRLRCW